MRHGIAITAAAMALLFLLACPASAGSTASHQVSFSIAGLSMISVSGDPGPMEVLTAKDQKKTSEVTDASTSYSFFTNARSRKITGSLDRNTPPHTVLKVNLAAPAGATSLGEVSLSTSPSDLVTGAGKKTAKNLPITYRFQASGEAGKVPLTSRTVTFTITGE
ncbi:MAG: hypothetical protein RDV48_27975 [Candidatus Eremiobacteraeota bacterium]|nr:hypothetical protein [Candidatus Eremiobacteraeota bacterium]